MRKKITLLLLGLVFFASSKAQTLDQSNELQIGTGAQVTNNGFTFERGQSFTTGISGQLTRIDFYVRETSFVPGTISLELREGSGFQGQLLATESIVLTFIDVESYINVDLTSSNIEVTENSVYTFRLRPVSAGVTVNIGNSQDTYAGGNAFAKINDFAETAETGFDLAFKSYVLDCPATSSITNITSCTPVVWNGVTYDMSGTYNTTGLSNAAGCDSTATLNLIVNSETTSEIIISQCGNYITPSGKTLSISGIYQDTIPNSASCDSVITINYTNTVAEVKTVLYDEVICAGSIAEFVIENSDLNVNYRLYNAEDDEYVTDPITGNGSDLLLESNTRTDNSTFRIATSKIENNAAVLPNSNDYVLFDQVFSQYGNAITIESMVYFDGTTMPWAGQGSKDLDNMNVNVWLWHSGIFYVNNVGTWLSTSMPLVTTSGWKHVATVADATGLRVYYDGVLVGSNNNVSTTGVRNNSSSNISLGVDIRFINEVARNSNSSFDNFVVWNESRTPEQIVEDMTTCFTGDESGLVFYADFNNVNGTTFTANKGGNGTFVNPANQYLGQGVGNCSLATCSSAFGIDYDVTVIEKVVMSVITESCDSVYVLEIDSTFYVSTELIVETIDPGNEECSITDYTIVVDQLAIPVIALTNEAEGTALSISNESDYDWDITYGLIWYDCETDNIVAEDQMFYIPTYTSDFRIEMSTDLCYKISDCLNFMITATSDQKSITNSVYPNPSTGVFELNLTSGTEYQISTTLGTVIESGIFSKGTQRLDISNYSEGVYILSVEGEITKLVLKK